MPRALRLGADVRAVPRAQAPPPRARAAAGLGLGPSPPRSHQALLRSLHACDRRLGLRPARRWSGRPRRGSGLRRGLPAVNAGRDRGALEIVLHTHMPYVEGFGTWPFGEEWLWEAIAGCYLPLLDLLDRDVPLTLSLTPGLCDQLQVHGLAARFAKFVEEVRRHTHEEDIAGLRAGGHETLARELERAWGDYTGALERLGERGGDLLGAFAPHAQWTSAATHTVLPLVATHAGVRPQVRTGVDAHRARVDPDGWQGGFWLPECGHTPWLEPALVTAGARAT